MSNLKTIAITRQALKIFTLLVLFISCGQSEKSNITVDSTSAKILDSQINEKVDCALKFINAYVENSNKLNQATGISEWVNSNSLTTKSFKTELKNIIDEANKQDPELGLNADPIFDAQDNPSKGFELDSLNAKTNYLTVKGKDMPEFKLTMKVIQENGKWLVEGCGIVNIPKDKRASR